MSNSTQSAGGICTCICQCNELACPQKNLNQNFGVSDKAYCNKEACISNYSACITTGTSTVSASYADAASYSNTIYIIIGVLVGIIALILSWVSYLKIQKRLLARKKLQEEFEARKKSRRLSVVPTAGQRRPSVLVVIAESPDSKVPEFAPIQGLERKISITHERRKSLTKEPSSPSLSMRKSFVAPPLPTARNSTVERTNTGGSIGHQSRDSALYASHNSTKNHGSFSNNGSSSLSKQGALSAEGEEQDNVSFVRSLRPSLETKSLLTEPLETCDEDFVDLTMIPIHRKISKTHRKSVAAVEKLKGTQENDGEQLDSAPRTRSRTPSVHSIQTRKSDPFQLTSVLTKD